MVSSISDFMSVRQGQGEESIPVVKTKEIKLGVREVLKSVSLSVCVDGRGGKGRGCNEKLRVPIILT